MARKPDIYAGEDNGQAKLSEADVAQIVRRVKAGERQAAVAASFGICNSEVNRIMRGGRWVTTTSQTPGFIPHPPGMRSGEDHYGHKLTAAQVAVIRRQLNEGRSMCSLAKLYGVDYTTINAIKYRRTWKCVEAA